MQIPSFFIVGAPKSATTAMWTYLSQHPDIFMTVVKELQFFGTDLEFGPPAKNFSTVPRTSEETQRYLSFFGGAREGQVAGEASVWYLYSKRAASEIYDFNPRAKIIMILRNPVDLLYSLHSQYLSDGNEDIEDFQEALAAEDVRRTGLRTPRAEHFRQGLYYREIVRFERLVRRYLEVFPEQQVMILLYDDIREDVSASFEKILTFLGVDGKFRPDFVPVNVNKTVRLRRLQEYLMVPGKMLTTLARLLPARARSRLRRSLMGGNTKVEPRAPLPPELRERFLGEFSDEIHALERLTGLDLDAWR